VRRGAVAFIFVTVLLDMLALGLVIPILPKLLESFVGGDTARAARIFGVFGTAWALMQRVLAHSRLALGPFWSSSGGAVV
jgi:MFS transporter, DHA1 family, tetracycline resistance protein